MDFYATWKLNGEMYHCAAAGVIRGEGGNPSSCINYLKWCLGTHRLYTTQPSESQEQQVTGYRSNYDHQHHVVYSCSVALMSGQAGPPEGCLLARQSAHRVAACLNELLNCTSGVA